MGISKHVGQWLVIQGHDAVHLDFENLFNLPDNLIIDKAIAENRIILTSDMDFGQLLAFNKSKQTSVIQFRLTDFTPANVQAKLEQMLTEHYDLLNGDFILTIEDNRTRFRRLPI